MTVLLIDNYDSFTHNLYQLIAMAGVKVWVHRNDQIDRATIEALDPSHVVLSPGPGHPGVPRDFGICADLITDPLDRPLLGVCLGHQGIAHHLGGRVIRAPSIMHGKTSAIFHHQAGLFAGLDDGFEAMRYHSLTVDPEEFPKSLEITARTADGVIMGLRHRTRPMYGLQFHPESIGTPAGARLIRNFLDVQ